MQLHELTTQRTAHYYSSGELNGATKFVWIVCHGYGQLASSFIRHFSELPSEHFVIAPEGLSKFYWENEKGRNPVASWMTREHRLDEIADYCFLLDKLYLRYISDRNVTPVFLGFSQGVSTIIRWMNASKPKLGNLILWAGNFPEDIDYSKIESYLSKIKTHYVYGLADQYITEKRKTDILERLGQSGLKYKVKTFEGMHKMNRAVLNKIVSEEF